MYNAKLHALFSGWEYQTNQLRNKIAKKIDKTVNVQYTYCPGECWEKCKNNSDKRAIMFVGQRPGKWWSSVSVIDGMEFSEKFISENWGSGNPFFDFMRDVEIQINKINKDQQWYYYWTNVFRLATEENAINDLVFKNTQEYCNEYIYNIHTLHEEIEIVDPDVIIFLTGPTYDQYLEKIFSCTFQPVPTVSGYHDIKLIAKVTAVGLPEKTFRTYHPGFLRRSQMFKSILDIIKTLV